MSARDTLHAALMATGMTTEQADGVIVALESLIGEKAPKAAKVAKAAKKVKARRAKKKSKQ